MSVPLQITFKGMPPSEAVEERIRIKADKLSRLHARITNCHVVVEAPHRHQHKGNRYQIRVDLTVPGGEVVVNREAEQNPAHEDVYVAIRDAFEAAARQLGGHVQKRRGDVKSHESV